MVEYYFKNGSYIRANEPIGFTKRANSFICDDYFDSDTINKILKPFIKDKQEDFNMTTYNVINATTTADIKSSPITFYPDKTATLTIENATVNRDFFMNYFAKECSDNKVTYAYLVSGMTIKCEEEFKNADKKMYLHFSGKGEVFGKELIFNEKIYVDTAIYNRYDWYVKSGILYVTLYEIINERPDFKRVEKNNGQNNK